MFMRPLSLEKRVAALEREVADLKALQSENGTHKKDWRRTIGMFTDNPGMLEIFAEAMKIREGDRKQARREHGKRSQAKS
jgi:hypothetical protein